MTLTVTVNGTAVVVRASPVTPLLDVLREELGDTSPKPGCREGRCGACTVLLDGEPAVSCMIPLGRVAGCRVTTLRGLSASGAVEALQRSFATSGASQCGICTPGMLVAAHALLRDNPAPTREDIREALQNNLCRCTGYARILDAVEAAASPGAGAGDG